MPFCLWVADDTIRVPRSPGRPLLRGIGARRSGWPMFLYTIQFSEQTSTPPGPSVPPGTAMR